MSDLTFAEFEALPDIEKLRYRMSPEDLIRWAPDIQASVHRNPDAPRQPMGPDEWLDLTDTDWDKQYTDAQWAVLFPRFTATNWRYYWAHVKDSGPFFRWSARFEQAA